MTLLGVVAPDMTVEKGGYQQRTLEWLTEGVEIIYQVSRKLQTPVIMSGLLGGGAFKGNRPLIMLLHLILQPTETESVMMFHYPVFWSHDKKTSDVIELEERLQRQADKMLEQLRLKGANSLDKAIAEIVSWKLPLSKDDDDILTELPFTINEAEGSPQTQAMSPGGPIGNVQDATLTSEASKHTSTVKPGHDS